MSHFSHMLRKLAGQAQLIVALVTLALAALAVGMWLYLSTRPAEPQAALPLTAPPTAAATVAPPPTATPAPTLPPTLPPTQPPTPMAAPVEASVREAVPADRAYAGTWERSVIAGNLAENYPRFIRHPRFTLYYQPDTYTALHVEETVALVEGALAAVEERLGVTMSEPFEVLVAGTLYERPNAHLRGLAASDVNQVYVLHDGTGTEADNAYFFAHELGHLVAAHEYGSHHDSILLSEGVATWAAMPALEAGGYLPADELCAAMHAAGIMPSMVDIEEDREAFKGHIRHPFNYFGAGCFVGYLVDNYGLDALRVVYPTSAYTAVYGKSLGALDAEFRAALAARWAQGARVDAARLPKVASRVSEVYAYVFYHYDDADPVYYEAYLAADRARVALWQGDFNTAEQWVQQARAILGWGG